jgi:O-antigen/teichoic acid export membrane protein
VSGLGLDSISLLVRNAGLQIGIQVVSKVVGTVVFVLLAAQLAPEVLGLYSANLAYVTLILTFSVMGVPSVVQREVARDPSSAPRYLCSMLTLRVPLLAACVTLAVGGSYALDYGPHSRQLVGLLLASEGLMAVTNSLCSFFQARQKSHVEAIVRLAYVLPYLAAVLVILKSGGGLVEVLYASVALNALTLALALWLLRAMLPPFRYRPDPRGALDLFRLGMPFLLMGLISNWNVVGSVLLVERLVGAGAAGNYSAGEKLVLAFLFLLPCANNAVIPALSRQATSASDGLRDLLGQVLKYLSLIGLPIGILAACLGGPVIARLYGDKYPGADAVLALVGAAVSIAFVNHAFIMALVALRRERTCLAIVCSNVVVHLALAVPLCERLGATGMAWAVLARHVWSLVLTLALCRGLLADLPRQLPAQLASLLGAGCLMGLTALALRDLGVVAAASAGSAAYLVGLVLFRAVGPGEIGYFRHALGSPRR